MNHEQVQCERPTQKESALNLVLSVFFTLLFLTTSRGMASVSDLELATNKTLNQ